MADQFVVTTREELVDVVKCLRWLLGYANALGARTTTLAAIRAERVGEPVEDDAATAERRRRVGGQLLSLTRAVALELGVDDPVEMLRGALDNVEEPADEFLLKRETVRAMLAKVVAEEERAPSRSAAGGA